MKTATTTAAQLEEAGRRLDASYHASEGVRTHRFIREWAGQTTRPPATAKGVIKERAPVYSKRRLDTVTEVCIPGGIFIGGRAKRIYVVDKERGVPFLSSSDMLMASFDGVKLISRKQPELEALTLRKGWTLISRSGTIGNMAYAREDMDGLAGSEHIMRVVPDPKKIPPGYLFAYLRSPTGTALVKSGTFGSVVDTIEPDFVGSLPVPRLDAATEQRIHELIEEAAKQRVIALEKAHQADECASDVLGVQLSQIAIPRCYVASASRLARRLDATHHVVREVADTTFARSRFPLASIGTLLTDMFYLGKLHRVFVSDATSGVPLLSISDVQKAKLFSEKFISHTQSRNIGKAILEAGWVLVSRSGTPGLVIYTRKDMQGFAGSDDLIRLVPNQSKIRSGYLYTILSSVVGRTLLQSALHGSVQSHLPPEYVSQLAIPVPPLELQGPIHELVEGFAQALTLGSALEDQAGALLAKALSVPGASGSEA